MRKDLLQNPGVDKDYNLLIQQIGFTFSNGQIRAAQSVNYELIRTYWQIGKHIVDFEQNGKAKARYGSALLENISKDLKLRNGKGFSRSNLNYMRLVYNTFPICEEVPHKLNWTHLCELVKISDPLERGFYEKQCLIENWSTTELVRQKKSALFERIVLSTDKQTVLKLAKEGLIIQKPEDILKDSYVFEFLNIHENPIQYESDLENLLCNNLQKFLLELGKGFTYVGRQYRINISNKNYRIDLVFYHRILRCFVLIDLKINEVQHQDVGQMNLYLGYFASEENQPEDNPPIGIILAKEKDDLLIEYATYGLNSQLFVSKYQLYLPDKRDLQLLIEQTLKEEDSKTETNI